jgi:hypothetical protein
MANAASPSLNCPQATLRPGAQGIERVAVDDARAQILVTFLRPLVLPQQAYLLNPANYSLTGGQRLFPHVLKAEIPPATSPPQTTSDQVLLTLDGDGDFSVYTLTVTGPDIDPFFDRRKLRFRLGCDERFDCRPPAVTPPPEPELPVTIDYLAKDYSSFRQALLDFIPTRLPAWTERSEADLGMMLLELFAYTGDNLSYMQDRVANEAYLATATQRRSVAEHLELIGYQMDEGASASTWLQFQVSDVQTVTRELKVTNLPKSDQEPLVVFEPLAATRLDPLHNQMLLFTWGNTDCCLPQSALSAALQGSFPDLKSGDYLLIDDGDGQRDVVRITEAPTIAPSPIVTSPPSFMTSVSWSNQTPLHFDYCTTNVIVRGNMVVATHGETVTETLSAPDGPQRPRIELANAPLAHLDPATLALVAPPVADSTPVVPDILTRTPRSTSTLQLQVDGEPWQEQQSLLDSSADAHVYRVEIDDEGLATVVFGQGGSGTTDEQFGLRPTPGAVIEALYRVGGGANGNLAPDTLVQPHPSAFDSMTWFVSVTNPLPATGGRDLESRDHARRFGAPGFHNPLVAVTVADYQNAAQEFTESDGSRPIQRANASFRWTGSWLTVTLGVDPRGAEGLTPQLRTDLLNYLETRRLAGYDLEVTAATYIPVDLILNFCVKDGFRSADVQQRIEQALSNSVLPGGTEGFFHPDNFSFGDPIFVSRLYAAVMSVPGVESVRIVRLARLHAAHPDDETKVNLKLGQFTVGPNEIVRLDNDRNFPENGALTVQSLEAGR